MPGFALPQGTEVASLGSAVVQGEQAKTFHKCLVRNMMGVSQPQNSQTWGLCLYFSPRLDTHLVLFVPHQALPLWGR